MVLPLLLVMTIIIISYVEHIFIHFQKRFDYIASSAIVCDGNSSTKIICINSIMLATLALECTVQRTAYTDTTAYCDYCWYIFSGFVSFTLPSTRLFFFSIFDVHFTLFSLSLVRLHFHCARDTGATIVISSSIHSYRGRQQPQQLRFACPCQHSQRR